jgi:hypothetical protein
MEQKRRFAPHFQQVEFQQAGQGKRPKTAIVDTRQIADPA